MAQIYGFGFARNPGSDELFSAEMDRNKWTVDFDFIWICLLSG